MRVIRTTARISDWNGCPSCKYSGTSTYGHLSTTATFFLRPLVLADSPYIGSSLNLSTTATSLCPQGVVCGEVQLYWWVTTVSHNLEEVLISNNRLEKSLNSVEVLEKYMISFLGLENTLTFTNNLVYATPFSVKLDC